MRRTWMPLLALTLVAGAGAALALGSAAEFSVQINLNILQGGRCVHKTLSQQTQGLVQVVCDTGEFVAIEPFPGKPFLGTHGAASRFHIPMHVTSPGILATKSDPYFGAGTITALRIYNVHGEDGRVEMLVSF